MDKQDEEIEPLDEPTVPNEPLSDIFGDGEPTIEQPEIDQPPVPAEPIDDPFGISIEDVEYDDRGPGAMSYCQFREKGIPWPPDFWKSDEESTKALSEAVEAARRRDLEPGGQLGQP